jgi:hypothetical protein
MEEFIIRNGIDKIVSDNHIYKSQRGEISMLAPCEVTFGKYQIYCLKGDLFYGTLKFDSLEVAVSEIKQFLL